MEEFMFLGLRKTEGISMGDSARHLAEISLKCTEQQIRKMAEQGLLIASDRRGSG